MDHTEKSPPSPPTWLRALIRFDDGVAALENVLVVASLGFMLLLYFLYVVFRNVSASLGENWLAELALQLVLWVSIYGASLAARRGQHISIDIAPRLLPPKALRVVRLLTNTLAVAMSVVLCVAGWRYLFGVELAEGTQLRHVTISFGRTTLFSVPAWLFLAFVPVGFGLTAWHFFVLTVREVMGFPIPPEVEADPEAQEQVEEIAGIIAADLAPAKDASGSDSASGSSDQEVSS